ncbi:sterol desaturase family protein [Anaeromyxobacter diazotrophicus]|uniref:Sterol desaturase n=1 Tax=Anaeromyxobacter diazotrophicus TaxID=2590199 RepID=A0A7I9VLT2_9BACT|nr:sterol desaturase family protein [Anaeromyxobacter diazotrophicus]GEJ57373.1 sterol desaturase [Anaeromyxobacter diazotrophicus]
MPTTNYIALAIPFFLLLIGVELLAARARRRAVYRLADALADLGCGVGQQVVLVFAGAALLAAYAWLYQHARLVTFRPGSGWPWLVAFVAVDVAYYWWHRLSHEVNLLWAAHAVHHQSEDYNLAVALRQSVLTSFTSLPFYLPMAFLGVPTAVYATSVAVSTLYQFWIHTELVGKLGPLERVLNTPSHHRVHHAVNPQYLDKNYGAILIVWDRLFGTFREERAPAVYGTTKPLASFNPAWAQVQTWFEIAEKARALPRRRDRLRLWLASPAVDPLGRPAPTEEALRARPRHDVLLAPALQGYALVQFAPLVAATFVMLLAQDTAPRGALAAAGALALWTLASLGGLLDRRGWAWPVEGARLLAVGAALAAARPLGTAASVAAGAAWAAGSALWLARAARAQPGGTDSSAPVPRVLDGRAPAAGGACSSP